MPSTHNYVLSDIWESRYESRSTVTYRYGTGRESQARCPTYRKTDTILRHISPYVVLMNIMGVEDTESQIYSYLSVLDRDGIIGVRSRYPTYGDRGRLRHTEYAYYLLYHSAGAITVRPRSIISMVAGV